MSNLKNSVRLMGHLGQNPEVRTTPTGKKVASFSLATNESYTDTNGEKVTETMWHNLVAWGRQADIAEKYLEKGKEICIEGKISNRNYVDKNGQKKYITEIIVADILMLGSKEKKAA
ncbi:MAG: single-stranded DNA-binding protein [Bacteroidia bacterium]|nr:single-stranded DNA-binding protein [Bacteroidota bacterium]